MNSLFSKQKFRLYSVALIITIFGSPLFGLTLDYAEVSHVNPKVETRFFNGDQSNIEPKTGIIAKLFEPIFTFIFKIIGEILSGLFDLISTVFKGIWEAFSWVLSKLGDAFSWVFEQIERLVEIIVALSPHAPSTDPYKPVYSFVKFDEVSTDKSLNQDDFLLVNDTDLQSTEFKKFISSNSHSRILYKSTVPDEKNTNALNEWVKRPQIFFAIPKDIDGVKNIYSHSFTSGSTPKKAQESFYKAATKQMISAREVASGSIAEFLDKSNRRRVTYKKHILNYIKHSEDVDPIFIFAHNEHGTLFFPDNSQLTIEEFSLEAKKKGRLPIVISCNTYKSTRGDFNGVITTSSLRFGDFSEGLIAAQKILDAKKGMHLGTYLKIFDTTFVTMSVKRDKKIKIILVSVPVPTTGGLVIVASIVVED